MAKLPHAQRSKVTSPSRGTRAFLSRSARGEKRLKTLLSGHCADPQSAKRKCKETLAVHLKFDVDKRRSTLSTPNLRRRRFQLAEGSGWRVAGRKEEKRKKSATESPENKIERLSEENHHHKIAPTSVHMASVSLAAGRRMYRATQTETHPIRLLSD